MSPPSLAEDVSVSSPYDQVLDRGTGRKFIFKLIYNIDKMILYNYDQTVVLYLWQSSLDLYFDDADK